MNSVYIHLNSRTFPAVKMALLDLIFSSWILLLLPIYLSLYYILPYFFQYRHLISIPGPFFAKFSNIWLALQAKRGQKFASVDAAHGKYGKIIRVGYNHISIADEKALMTVYGHGNGFLKELGAQVLLSRDREF